MSTTVYESGQSVRVSVTGNQGPPGANGGQGAQGATGGNIMAIGTFASAKLGSMSIPTGTNRVDTSGYNADGDGGNASYARRASGTLPTGLPERAFFYDIDGRLWTYIVEGPVRIEQFGGKNDCPRQDFGQAYKTSGYTASSPLPAGVTDNLPALQAAEIVAAGKLRSIFTVTESGTQIPVDFNGAGDSAFCYAMSGRWDPIASSFIRGTFSGGDNVSGTMLRFPPNTGGVKAHTQFSRDPANPATGCAGLRIEGIAFEGGGGTDRNAHGLEMLVSVFTRNVAFRHFAGHGRYNEANANRPVTDPRRGVTSGSSSTNTFFANNGQWGSFTIGADVSASVFAQDHVKGSRLGGIYDSGLYNNAYPGAQINEFGDSLLGSAWLAGYNWQLMSSVPGIGSSTQPGTNEDVWEALQPAAGPSTRYQTWSASNTYEFSAPIYLGGIGSTSDVYIEDYYLVGIARGGSYFTGGVPHASKRSPVWYTVPSVGRTLFNRAPLGYRRAYIPPDPTMGDYVQREIGDGQNPAVFDTWMRASEGPTFKWVRECIGPDEREGFGSASQNTGINTRLKTGFNTTQTLGEPAVQKGYEVGARFALGDGTGSFANARIFQMTAVTPTAGAAGSHKFTINGALGGIDAYRGMADGTVQPVGIIGAVQAVGLNTGMTLAQLVQALLDAKLGRV